MSTWIGPHTDLSNDQLGFPAQKPRRTVAASDMVGGEFLVMEGDVLGPIIARFPRTAEGHDAAKRMAGER